MELCSRVVTVAVQQTQPVIPKAKRKNQRALKFSKYQELGNDFLVVDNRDSSEPMLSRDDAVKICNRNFGVGADGVILVKPGVAGCNYSMRIFNSDGSEPENYGCGLLCMVCYLAEQDKATQHRSYKTHTDNPRIGIITPKLRDGQVVVDMGSPILNWNRIPTLLPGFFDGSVIKKPLAVDGKTWLATCVGLGTPHCITFGDDNEEAVDFGKLQLETLGPLMENHKKFPHRTNAEFVEVASRTHLNVRMWERSPGATRASGACAAVVAGALEGRVRKNCTVELEPGGKVEVEWRETDQHVYMTGKAEFIFSGTIFV